MNEINKEKITNVSFSQKRKSYTLKYKLDVVNEAEKSSNRASAAKFGIDEAMVRRWRNSKTKLTETAENEAAKKRRIRETFKPQLPELEENLKIWIEEKRSRRLCVSRKMIQKQALNMFQDLVTLNEREANTFKASRGWLERFLKRCNFSLRRRTSVCQKVPEDLIPKLVNFVAYIRNLQIKHKYMPSCIFAADETAVWFDMIADTTIEHTGAKHVSMRSTGHEKSRLTVMLTARADGKKLKPFVILKRKRPLPDLEKRFPTMVFAYSENGWMDNALTAQYLKKVIGTFSFQKRLLVWDAFRCHISDETKAVLHQILLHSAVVPGGCTAFMQAPDVSWNKPFKAHIREDYEEFMEREEFEYTKGGSVKAAPFEKICQWILSAWNSISSEIIEKSFKSCALNLAVDGSEDGEIMVFKSDQCCADGRRILQEKIASLLESEVEVINENNSEDVLENLANMQTEPEESSDDDLEL